MDRAPDGDPCPLCGGRSPRSCISCWSHACAECMPFMMAGETEVCLACAFAYENRFEEAASKKLKGVAEHEASADDPTWADFAESDIEKLRQSWIRTAAHEDPEGPGADLRVEPEVVDLGSSDEAVQAEEEGEETDGFGSAHSGSLLSMAEAKSPPPSPQHQMSSAEDGRDDHGQYVSERYEQMLKASRRVGATGNPLPLESNPWFAMTLGAPETFRAEPVRPVALPATLCEVAAVVEAPEVPLRAPS